MNTDQNHISDYWNAKSVEYLKSKDNDIFNNKYAAEKHKAEVKVLDSLGLKRSANKKGRLLDLGCGAGRLIKTYYQYFDKIVGTELNKELVDKLHLVTRRHDKQHIHIMQLDLTEKEFDKKFNMTFTHVFMFGVSQLILEDGVLFNLLLRLQKMMEPGGKIYLKQTTSIVKDRVNVSTKKYGQKYLACYRTEDEMRELCKMANLNVEQCFDIYTQELLGRMYNDVEPYDNTRQKLFIISK